VTEYSIAFAASAGRELKDLPSDLLGRLFPRIRDLAANPRPSGCKKLHGYGDLWRIRVGDYRVIYVIEDDQRSVLVTRIAHRREAYD
jgi:mRNA interferase RelE/StbE